MKENYKKILKQIEKHGFKAYIVGGYVRDTILGIKSSDVDIITDAKPQELKKIFSNVLTIYNKYGSVKLKLKSKIIDITTFRRELSYKNGKPNKIEYTNILKEDLIRRDFKMNTLCMDSNGNIIDLLNGLKDIQNKKISCVRNTETELKEDPSRILRALRFMSELNFNLDQNIKNYIIKNKNQILKINPVKKKEELTKLFKTKKVKPFLDFIKLADLEKVIGIKSINFKETNTIIGVWSQLEVKSYYMFSKKEKEQIKKVKALIKKQKIDVFDLYNNGIFICTIAADILGLNKKELNLIYTNLPIKGIMDIDIKSEEIMNILNINPSKELGEIIKVIEKEIIKGKLKNEKEEIIKRLKELR